MKDYIILTDSTSDLPLELVESLGIEVIAMNFFIDEREYEYSPYKEDLSMKDFYDGLRKGEASATSQINILHYMDIFRKYLEEGRDILYIAFSSALSGTYSSSLLAKEGLEKEYPNSKILCVDSRAASLGEGLLVYLAVQEKLKGKSIEEVAQWLEQNRDRLCHWFTVDDLEHLYRGGRVSRASAALGSALKIKPVLHVNKKGELIPQDKVRGRKKSLKELVNKMEKYSIDPREQVVFIGHGDDLEGAEFVADMIREKFGPREILINHIGPIIGSHSGPGTIALFFYGEEEDL